MGNAHASMNWRVSHFPSSMGGAQEGAREQEPNEQADRRFGHLISTRGPRCVVTFQNHSDVALRLLWIDFKAQPVQYNRLLPQDASGPKELNTFETHPWVLMTDAGEVYATYVGALQPTRRRCSSRALCTCSSGLNRCAQAAGQQRAGKRPRPAKLLQARTRSAWPYVSA